MSSTTAWLKEMADRLDEYVPPKVAAALVVPSHPSGAGYVYAMATLSDPPKTKIGYTNDPRRRLAEIQAGNPFKVVLVAFFRSMNARGEEAALHERFSEYKATGGTEWFSLPPDKIGVLWRASMESAAPAPS